MSVQALDRYHKISILLHWLIAALVFLMLGLGAFMDEIGNQSLKMAAFTFHKSLGLTILVLMIIRLGWRWSHPAPALPSQMVSWERFLSKLTHGLFYLILILMPLDGWIMSMAAGHPVNFFWLGTIPSFVPESRSLAAIMAEVHEFLAWTLLSLILLHTAAALKHHFYDKDNVLTRMLP